MADEHIPAWKRLGLKVKKSQSDDPLSIPTHLEDASITKNQAKALKSQKRSREEANDKQNKPKKPPKRKKLPKSERPPPPEKDQLVYLRAFSTDKENWKFSKQKQNWLIKHVLTIPEEYDEYTLAYFRSIQGGSQIRVKRELKEVIDKWNEYANSVGNALLNSDGEKEKGEKEDEKVEDEKMKEKTEEKKIVISIEQAFKAQRVYEAVSGEKLSLATIDEDAEPEKEAKNNENEKESDETSEDEQKVLAENERKIMKNTKEKVEDKKEEVDNKEKTEKKDKKDKKDKKGKKGKKDKKDKKGKKDKKDKIDKKEKEGNEESDNDARTPQPSNVTVNQEESSQAMSDQEISDEEDEGNYSNVWVEEVEVTDFV